jgi:hypothetical protein
MKPMASRQETLLSHVARAAGPPPLQSIYVTIQGGVECRVVSASAVEGERLERRVHDGRLDQSTFCPPSAAIDHHSTHVTANE